MDNEYFLVSWVNETPIRWSIMNRKDIVDQDQRRLQSDDLLNSEVCFKWGKKSCVGKISASGTKASLELKRDSEILASNVPKTKASRSKIRNQDHGNAAHPVSAKKSKIDSIVARADTAGSEETEQDRIIASLRSQLQEEKLKRKEVEDKYEDLLKKQDDSDTQGTKVDIGNGILITRELLSSFRTVSPTMNIYARMLFKNVFEIHEIVGRSLMGKPCNVNKNKNRQPSIDPVRRDAIICHSLAVFGKHPGSELYKLGIKDLKKSLSALILELQNDANEIESAILTNE